MKPFKKVLTILLIIASIGFFLILVPKPKFQKENPFIAKDFPLVMAHAGGKGVYPDNTMLAYMYSFSIGVDVLEMDVMMTKDGILVLLHGENQTGNTRSHSNCDTVVWQEDYEYLYQNCNFGYHYQEKNGDFLYQDMTPSEWQEARVYLPTLEEVFVQFGNQILYNIEIKADSDAPRLETADALYELIALYHLEDYVLVACAFDDINLHLVNNYPNLYVSTAYGSAQKMIISIYTLTSLFSKSPMHAAVQVPTSYTLPVIGKLRLDTKLLIRTLKQHNMAMHYWTVNDEETMRFLIEQGADGIITDYPELLISIINEYKNS
jgi:glycerophosphoryl diester phosphodiesterase